MTAPIRDVQARYGAVAMVLHWTIALLIIVNIVIGLSMTEPPVFPLIALHKSIGFTVLVLSVLRLVWRWVNPVPPSLETNRMMRAVAHGLHHLFYFMIVAIPLAGWLMVSSGAQGHPTSVFGLFNWPAFPVLSEMTRSQAHPWHEAFETIHIVLAWAMIGLVPLHILAALFHHHFRRDNVLLRMLPGARLRSGL